MKKIKIAVGIATADYGNLAAQLKEAMDAGCDILHADAADMYELPDIQLMGGPQTIKGVRGVTTKPIECHFYTSKINKIFIESIAEAGANMLILPAEYFMGAQLAYIINWCRNLNMKVGLTIGCYAPLSLIEESIYDIDRLHIVTHGVDDTDGGENWMWRKSVVDLVKRARREIDLKNPKCELAIDGGLRFDNIDELIKCNPDVVVLSSALLKDDRGIKNAVKSFNKKFDS
ncbi:MAG: pentose-5-phosphate 3-epimerase, partial [Erysipelotrichales bacterium]|nr:pentose-5-phosphate 3-epimerase [Erysipelotrichales bacterium]